MEEVAISDRAATGGPAETLLFEQGLEGEES